MRMRVHVPKPLVVLSRVVSRQGPDGISLPAMARLPELYPIGEPRTWRRAPASANGTNLVVTTSLGKFVLRRHRLSQETVAHEHEVLAHLQKHGFPSPRVVLNRDGGAWSMLEGTLYSVYEYIEGYALGDLLWTPSGRQEMLRQAGRTLAEYHRAVSDLVPSFRKWDGYRPTGDRRWREGDWFRRAITEVRLRLAKQTAYGAVEDYARAHLGALEQMLKLEPVVEGRSELTKAVIHGDYAPWNVILQPSGSLVVLDLNSARIDLRIFDITFATFWFAWHRGHYDLTRAMAFQAGYSELGQLSAVDLDLAGPVFQWVTARALSERLRRHYEEQVLLDGTIGLERLCSMCAFAQQHPQLLVAGLKETTGR